MSEAVAPARRYIVLPKTVVTKVDVARLVRELEQVDVDMTAQVVRSRTAQSSDGTPDAQNTAGALGVSAGVLAAQPTLSPQLADFLEQNALGVATGQERSAIIKQLRILKDKVPVLHMTFAVTADSQSLQTLVDWARTHVHPQAVIEVGLQPGLVAGVHLRTPNHIHDFTIRHALTAHHDSLVKQLEVQRGNK